MKKKYAFIFLIIICIHMVVFANPTSEKPVVDEVFETVTVTDHNGDVVEVKKNPTRVVITDIYPLPSIITVFLNSCSSIVGVHPVSMSAAENGLLGELYPDFLDINTDFMSGGDLNIEQLLLLKPDVVFYNAAKKAQGVQLRNAGLKAIGISTSKWDYDVLKTYNEWIDILGQIFPNHAEVSEKVKIINEKTLDKIQKNVSSIPEEDKKSVLFLFNYDDKKMITSGKHFFGQWWANAIGAKNIAEEINLDNANAVITMEQVYKWNPDVIFITNFTPAMPEDLYNNAIGNDDWSNVKAVKNKQVYKMPLGIYRSYTPGIDTPLTLFWMACTVYPELFKSPFIDLETIDYYDTLFGIELTSNQVNKIYNPEREASKGFIPTSGNNK